MNALIREATLSDVDGLLELLPQLTSRPNSAAACMPVRSEAIDILQRQLATTTIIVLVAEMLEIHQLVGTATLIVVPNLTNGGRSWAAIENVVVDNACRRHGIGAQLMTEAIRRAKVEGCYKVQLISGPKPEQTSFYSSLGFESTICVGHRMYFRS